MFSKTSVVIAIGMSSFLAAANPIRVARTEPEIVYPEGMPFQCRQWYTPPTVCAPTIPTPSSNPTPSYSQPPVFIPTHTPVKPTHSCPEGTHTHHTGYPPTPTGGNPTHPPGSPSAPHPSSPSFTPSVPVSSPSYTPSIPVTSPSYTPSVPVSSPSYTPSVPFSSPSYTPSVPITTPSYTPSIPFTPIGPSTTTKPPASYPVHTPTRTITVTSPPTATSISQCNTGNAQCCNSVQKGSHHSATKMLGLLGIVLDDVDVLVGLQCSPITAIGVAGGVNCAQQPVCCSNNTYNGLINIGCTPISL